MDEIECPNSGDGEHSEDLDTGLCYVCRVPLVGPVLMPCGEVFETVEAATAHMAECPEYAGSTSSRAGGES